MNKSARIFFVLVALLVLLVVFMQTMGRGSAFTFASPQQFSLNEFDTYIDNTAASKTDEPRILTAEWQGEKIKGEYDTGAGDKKTYEVAAYAIDSDAGAMLAKQLTDANIDLKRLPPPLSASLLQVLGFLIFPITLIVLFYYFLIKPAQSGGAQAMNFGRSKARRAGESTPKVTFEDVGGIDEAKEELYEVVDYLRNTKKYVALGAKIPKGILLEGPPGVGKTHLARAIAGEAGVPFFHISGSDFVEMFVGVGAARVRDLFETAKAHRPCLIFVDEIDAVGRQRGAGVGGGHDEREQTLNQLLVEMDGFEANTGVIMIAATNRPDVLDPALLRPGRFDRRITVDAPDLVGREMILKIHAKGKPFAKDIDLKSVAKLTPGFTGADLANTLNEAALLAARRNHAKISKRDIFDALDRVIAGPERKSRIMDEKEKEIIAYHEAGHAIIGESLENHDPIHKVTILPRGMSLGSTWHLPEKDTHLVSKQKLLDDITSLLGGRIAEELRYGEVWTGAAHDFSRVTQIARAMVMQLGMSEKIGTWAVGRRSANPFLGRDYYEDRDYSEEVAQLIDEEVRHIVEQCRQRAIDILTQKRAVMDKLVQALLDRETLDREEFLAVYNGKELPPQEPDDTEIQSDEDAPSEPTAKTLKPGNSTLKPDPA